jgi:hypothetical protein
MVYHKYVGMYCDIYPEQNGDTFSSKVDCKYSPCKLNEKKIIDMHKAKAQWHDILFTTSYILD